VELQIDLTSRYGGKGGWVEIKKNRRLAEKKKEPGRGLYGGITNARGDSY